jgi:phospholipid/cholesterol/gamma-HCH transport system substrate-binding protein
MSQRLWPRLLALLVVVVLGVYFIAIDVMQYRIGPQRFVVTALMPAAGGLYPGADVTYRGVQVGNVTSLDVSTTGVAVKIGINPGERIPDNGVARVKELSALGEQYLDFQPAHAGGPYLHGGTVIPASRVVLPIPIGTALIDLGALLSSVNPQDLQTDESFLTTAFIGTGPSLRTIIVTGQQLFDALVAAQPETVNLVVDGKTDLQTLKATDGDLTTFSQGLAQLTGQLKNSNSDLQALINNGAAAAATAGPFLASNSASLEGTISNLSTDSQASAAYQPAVQALFQVLPIVATNLAGTASGGVVKGELSFNTANTVCPYIPSNLIPGPTEPVASAPLNNGCSIRAPDLLQRGAYNSPGGS